LSNRKICVAFTIPAPPDFSLRETILAHGWRQLLPFSWEDEAGVLERVERLSEGRGVLLTVRDAAGTLEICVSEPVTAAEEAEIRRRVSRMLQLDLPMDEFHAFCAREPKLAGVPARRQGRLLIGATLWEDIVKVILTTNTTWAQTRLMVQRIVEAYGSPLGCGSERRAFPEPERIAAVSLVEFSRVARLGYRNTAVYELAVGVGEGALDLEAWRDPDLTTAELRCRLLALRGVGPYAAACLLLYLGRYGRVNVDSWARMLVGKELGRAVSDKEVHEFFAPYGEWQALAYHFYPWREDEPAY
jgi:3-methyladenine DNA glycosylase/8-oxoguanine DNA glycosylase